MDRLRVELQQVEDALARQARRPARSQRSSGQMDGKAGNTRQRIVAVLHDASEPMTPSEILAALKRDGPERSRGAVHNMLARLVDSGQIAKLGEGRYELASRSNALAGEALVPSENGNGTALSMPVPSQSAP